MNNNEAIARQNVLNRLNAANSSSSTGSVGSNSPRSSSGQNILYPSTSLSSSGSSKLNSNAANTGAAITTKSTSASLAPRSISSAQSQRVVRDYFNQVQEYDNSIDRVSGQGKLRGFFNTLRGQKIDSAETVVQQYHNLMASKSRPTLPPNIEQQISGEGGGNYRVVLNNGNNNNAAAAGSNLMIDESGVPYSPVISLASRNSSRGGAGVGLGNVNGSTRTRTLSTGQNGTPPPRRNNNNNRTNGVVLSPLNAPTLPASAEQPLFTNGPRAYSSDIKNSTSNNNQAVVMMDIDSPVGKKQFRGDRIREEREEEQPILPTPVLPTPVKANPVPHKQQPVPIKSQPLPPPQKKAQHADGRKECQFCGRLFDQDRLEKHQSVCLKGKQKRAPFDASAMRKKGTDLDPSKDNVNSSIFH